MKACPPKMLSRIYLTFGAILSLLLLSGCASVSMGGASDPEQYNPATGYPAVGSIPGHL